MPLGGSPPKASRPPPLPPVVKSVEVGAGRKAGEDERKRLQGRRGRSSTVLAGRSQLQPATLLKKRLG